MTTCFDPHLGHLQANVLHKINYNCMLNLCVDRLRSQSVLKISHMMHMSTTVLISLKYVVIQHNAKIIPKLGICDLLQYIP